MCFNTQFSDCLLPRHIVGRILHAHILQRCTIVGFLWFSTRFEHIWNNYIHMTYDYFRIKTLRLIITYESRHWYNSCLFCRITGTQKLKDVCQEPYLLPRAQVASRMRRIAPLQVPPGNADELKVMLIQTRNKSRLILIGPQQTRKGV